MSEDFRRIFPGSWSWSGVWEPKAMVVSRLLRGQLGTQFREPFESHAEFFLADEDRVVVQAHGHTTTVRGDAYDNTYSVGHKSWCRVWVAKHGLGARGVARC